MLRMLILFLLSAVALTAAVQPPAAPTATPPASPQSDTLTAGVFPPNPTVLNGATRDLTDLDVRLISLEANQDFHLIRDSVDELLIIRDGTVSLDLDAPNRRLTAGGVVLLPADYKTVIHNLGDSISSFYLFVFKSRKIIDPIRFPKPFLANWPDLIMKSTPKGESRAIFSQPTTWLRNINMHATTLNPGEISHPQHMHRAEEILLIRSGNVRMHIGNGYIPAKAGDLVFLPSGVPHDLENGNSGRTEYFALQWEP